jgi:hypothetical protein
MPETHNLDRHRRVLAQARNHLAGIRHDHEAPRRLGHDLLAQQRAAQPLDKPQ